MEGVTRKKGTSSHDSGDDGAETSRQASQRDGGRKFDVFLSFRGADTRKGFTGHLYEALVQRGISTFIDNEELEKGERVEELFGYIERSSAFVPIISKGYADSKWCLREITKIVECGRLIIPVFFGVQPFDIRHQEGPFKEAFKSYESNEKLKKEVSDWKKALQEVGEISGFNLEDVYGNEAELIKRILERIMKEVNTRLLDLGDYPIGLDSRVNEVIKCLDTEIGMVGICGMGGIGKTTLAKAVYNKLCPSFKACSFLANVREESKHLRGIVGLQEQLLHDVLGSSELRVSNRDNGISLIKQWIGGRKVLVVVDDVDHKDQLDALVGSGSGWFSGKSRIIVTSRDENIFNASQVDIYRVAELNSVQSLQLFSQHAFGRPEPPSDWKGELMKKVVPIASGMPLCLKVFGSQFGDIESFEVGQSMLEKLKRDQLKEVHERLKISYDSLDENTQCIFLDIACLLIYWKQDPFEDTNLMKECVMFMWEASQLSPIVAIQTLRRKSLINVNDEDGTFEVHDQIRDMGRKIVQQQNPPSRFWQNNERLRQVLQNGEGIENIEGISFDSQTPLKTTSFRNMVKLRILDISNTRMDGPYHHLPNSLKILRWWRCPWKSVPIDFHVKNIVLLDLSYSNIEQFLGPSVGQISCFQAQEKFSQLKVLRFRNCKKLKSTPDFRLIPNATTLIFEGCTSLSEVHKSIGDLQSLVCLNLEYCWSLKKIPDSICRLSSLKKLILFGCLSLQELPEQIGRIMSLRELQLGQGQMSSIPESIGLLTNLEQLEIVKCELLTTIPDISKLHALRTLSLRLCSKLTDVPGLTKLRCLEELHLDGCHALWYMEHMKGFENTEVVVRLDNIVRLDLSGSTIEQFLGPSVTNCQPQEANHSGKLSQLKVLILENCGNLKSTPDFRLIPNATELIFGGCTALSEVHESIGDLQSLVYLNMPGCESLKKLPDSICRLSSLETLDLNHCYKISTLPDKLGDLRSLKKLFLLGCHSLQELPEQIGGSKSLRELRLSEGQMSSIPESVGQLTNLQVLKIFECKFLKTIPDISNLHALRTLSLNWCRQLMDVPGLTKLRCLKELYLGGCHALRDMEHMMKEAQLEDYFSLLLPGCPSASCHSESTRGVWAWSVTVSFHLPHVLNRGVTIYVEDSRPRPVIVTQIKAVKHDDSFTIYKLPETGWTIRQNIEIMIGDGMGYRQINVRFNDFSGPSTGPRIWINGCETSIPPEKAGMMEEKARRWRTTLIGGYTYRRIDVTFKAESDFSGSSFYITLGDF